MIVKIENMSQGYHAGVITIMADAVLYEGEIVLHKKGISSQCNKDNPNLKTVLINDLSAQAQLIKNTYIETMAAVAQAYPDATTPTEALALLAADIEGVIV